ncbi:4-diphosphocytidyl-2-C-methyl-D-erythritol kinase [Planctomycetes bacterium Pan216]|uniref:4-diphosphocytidyl-2-C-methyl-D-erythritol kinase n=1 Tax=Kolteria novifilia TaxID=2527975 RepID=A0A518BA15_9BACT|nr:4-diphosphocytidyl-2-C-methyl-D-erythritol kinase [Planctomycetes bacterium Pan216]
MIVETHGDDLVIKAPAKVNLHLEILGKRPDGYHELETLFLSVSLYDTLIFKQQPAEVSVRVRGSSLDGGRDNLVTRAIHLVRQEAGISHGISVELTKEIPAAAGLAGGSSDAAATLAGLNQWWNLGWSPERLAALGAQLGSDIPFFFHTPTAVARGRGEQVEPCRCKTPLDFVIVSPEEGLSTADVYRRVVVPPKPVSIEPIRSALEQGDRREVGKLLFNRLEEASVPLCPAVAKIKHRVGQDGIGQLMSGSGSSVFVLMDSPQAAERLGKQLIAERLGRIYVVQSSS